MKFPSIFRTAKPVGFEIKPRYYDPVREEIEQRTERIKRNLQAEGAIKSDGEMSEEFMQDYGSNLRGAFTQGGPISKRKSSPLQSAGFLRTVIFVLLVGIVFGYYYLGDDMTEILIYVGGGSVLLWAYFRLKGKIKQ
ncbi:hypothetical protein MM236_18340 [Belliella sp. DSM 107340]|uniref:Uncharacterized protein n=1 Tax=Belliella calami TaxID=2923436 RepID=A0ABS9UU68_9BACT|nr:hypothetical protein [Belliella calami]MCH7399960.1 hypothetical protein [Belliella calami]